MKIKKSFDEIAEPLREVAKYFKLTKKDLVRTIKNVRKKT